MTTNDCEGCNTYNVNANKIGCNHAYRSGICPCSICVVKVMCERSCDVFDKYVAKKLKLMVKQGDNYGQH